MLLVHLYISIAVALALINYAIFISSVPDLVVCTYIKTVSRPEQKRPEGAAAGYGAPFPHLQSLKLLSIAIMQRDYNMWSMHDLASSTRSGYSTDLIQTRIVGKIHAKQNLLQMIMR